MPTINPSDAPIVELSVANNAAARLLPGGIFKHIFVDGKVAAGDGLGGGIFLWNAADVSADNDGTVLAPAAGGIGRWNSLLLSQASSINFLQFGVGAVPRTVQNKERDIVALADFDTSGHFDTAAAALLTTGKFAIPGAFVNLLTTGLLSSTGAIFTGLSTSATGVGVEIRYDSSGAGTGALTCIDRGTGLQKAMAYDSLTHVFEVGGLAALSINAAKNVIGQNIVQAVTSLMGPLVTTAAVVDLGLSTNNLAAKWVLRSDTFAFVPKIDQDVDLGDPTHRPGKVVTTLIDSGTSTTLGLRTGNGTMGFQVLDVASGNRNWTVSSSNGGNPVLNTTAGGGDISPATIRFPNIGTTAVAANATLNAVGSNDLLRSTSSVRYKAEIEVLPHSEAIDLLKALRPITYASLCEQDDVYGRWPGLIAEEVFKINPLFVSFSKDDAGNRRPESVQYERLTVPLIAGWQDHEARLAALEARIN